MTTFFRGLTTARLVGLMETLRLVAPTKDPAPSGEPEVVQPSVGAMSDPDGATRGLVSSPATQRLVPAIEIPRAPSESCPARFTGAGARAHEADSAGSRASLMDPRTPLIDPRGSRGPRMR